MPRFHTRLHTGFCRIPLLWSFEPRSETGGRNFLESFDLISSPVKSKAGVPISCFEAGQGEQPFPHPWSREVVLQARHWGLWGLWGFSSLISRVSSRVSRPATDHFASLSKHLPLNTGFLCELDTTAHGQSIFGTKHLNLLPAIVVLYKYLKIRGKHCTCPAEISC